MFTAHTCAPFSVILTGQVTNECPPEMPLDSCRNDHDCEDLCDIFMQDGVIDCDDGGDSGADDSDHSSKCSNSGSDSGKYM